MLNEIRLEVNVTGLDQMTPEQAAAWVKAALVAAHGPSTPRVDSVLVVRPARVRR